MTSQRQNYERKRRETRTIRSLGPWSTNEEVIRLDVTIDQILLVYRLHARDLSKRSSGAAARLARAGDAPSAVRTCTPS
jgi:hypothetical protein